MAEKNGEREFASVQKNAWLFAQESPKIGRWYFCSTC